MAKVKVESAARGREASAAQLLSIPASDPVADEAAPETSMAGDSANGNPAAAASSTESAARISEPVRALVQLYGGPLADVRFPDADHGLLTTQIREVERLGGELQQALATVQRARAELESAQSDLHELARRALAYARVFAEGDDELSEQLAAISFDDRSAAPKRKRGRPRKPKLGESQTTLVVANDEE